MEKVKDCLEFSEAEKTKFSEEFSTIPITPPSYEPSAPSDQPPPYSELPENHEQSLPFPGVVPTMQYPIREFPETGHSLQLAEMLDLERVTASTTDIVLICGEKMFPAHKMVLSASSHFFRMMFASQRDVIGSIELPFVTASEMDVILPFLYTGKFKDAVDSSLLTSLLRTSRTLQISTLFERCRKKLCKGLSSTKFLELLNLAEELEDEIMKTDVVSFIAQNFGSVTASQEFLKLNASELQLIVQHPDAAKFCMDDLIKGLIQWSDCERSREAPLLDILTTVDLQQMSTTFLTEVLREKTLIKKNYHVLTLLTAEATSRMLVSSAINIQDNNEPKVLCFGQHEQRHIFRIFNMKQNCWSLPKSLPFHLEIGMCMVWFDGYVYVIGGGEINTSPSANVIKYHPATNTVASIRKLATAVCQVGAALLYEYIYVVNGLNDNAQTVTSVQRYNPVTGTCESVASTNTAHNLPHVYNVSNYLYALGSDKKQNTVERYDPNCDIWTVVTTVPGAIEWCSAAVISNKLFVAASRTTNIFQVYDLSSGTWVQEEIERTPDKILGLYSNTIQGKCILLVRDDKGGFHFYDTESGKWVQKSESNKEPWSRWQNCVV